MKTATTWQKGQSGNPKGRPPKNRALTTLLEKAADQAIEQAGKSAKEVVAAAVWEMLATGQANLPGGQIIKVEDAKEYTGLLKFAFGQIDGPPKLEIDLGDAVIGFTAEQLAALDAEADQELDTWAAEQDE